MQIRKIRQSLNMQQKQVAYAMGVSQGIVSSWESGRRLPSSANILKLSKLFGCSVEEIMGETQLQLIEPPQTKKADDTVIDSALVSLLTELSDQERQAVFAFVAGLKANRRE